MTVPRCAPYRPPTHPSQAGIGSVLGGWVADRLGRKPALLLADVLFAAGSAAMAAAQEHWALIAGGAADGVVACAADRLAERHARQLAWLPAASCLSKRSPCRPQGVRWWAWASAWPRSQCPYSVSCGNTVPAPLGSKPYSRPGVQPCNVARRGSILPSTPCLLACLQSPSVPRLRGVPAW